MKKIIKGIVITLFLFISVIACTGVNAHAKESFETVKVLMNETGLISKTDIDWGQEVGKSELEDIMKKLSGTEAEPENLNENGLYKVLVDITGYGEQVMLSGGSEKDYLLYANRLGITKDANPYDEKLTYTDMAIMIFNTFNVEVVERTTFGGGGAHFATTGETVLQKYFGIYRAEGKITATERSSLFNTSHLDEDYLEINNIAYFYNGELLGGDALGRKVSAYYRWDKNLDKKEIFYILYDENGVTTINMSTITNFDKKVFTYKENGKNVKRNISEQAVVIKNGVFKGYVSNLSKNEIYEDSMRGKIYVIDNDNDSVIDVVSIIVYDISIVKTVYADSKMISCKGRNIRLSETYNDEGCDYRLLLNGKDCSFDDIAQWNTLIVEYAQNTAGKKFYIINVVQRIVEGTISEKSDDKVWINNEEYTVLPSLGMNKIKIGMTGKFIIAGNNDIADIMVDDLYEYGYYILHEKGYGRKYQMVMIDASGKTAVLDIADNVRINDGSSVKASELSNYLTTHQLIGYNVNSDNLISKIYIAHNGYNEDAFSLCGARGERVYIDNNGNKGFDWEYFVSPDTITFYVDETDVVDEDAVTVGILRQFSYNEKVPCAIYDANRIGEMGALVIYSAAQEADIVEDSTCIEKIVEKVIYARDSEDEMRPQVIYYENGERKKAFFANEVKKSTTSTNGSTGSIELPERYMAGSYLDLKPGDIIKTTFDENGDIDQYISLFKAAETHTLGAGYQNNGNSVPNRDMVYSKILYMEGDKFVVNYNTPDKTGNRVYTIAKQTVVYKYDKEAKEITLGHISDLTDVQSAAFGDSATEALVIRLGGIVKAIIVFE